MVGLFCLVKEDPQQGDPGRSGPIRAEPVEQWTEVAPQLWVDYYPIRGLQ
jgi:hypothetical protein